MTKCLNNNVLIMIQIENPEGVGLICTILEDGPGLDIVMVASNDFGQQAGDRDGSASYNAREKLVREAVLAHGKYLAGPSSWRDRPGVFAVSGEPARRRRRGMRRGRRVVIWVE